MSSFAEIVAESFHSEVGVNWRLESVHRAVATFSVKTVQVQVDFEQQEPDAGWHVGFNTVRGEISDRSFATLAFRIFNGVFQAIREFIEVRQPELMLIVAKDEDLAGIYRTYLRREKSALENLGYKLEEPQQINPYTQWLLRRSRPADWKS